MFSGTQSTMNSQTLLLSSIFQAVFLITAVGYMRVLLATSLGAGLKSQLNSNLLKIAA